MGDGGGRGFTRVWEVVDEVLLLKVVGAGCWWKMLRCGKWLTTLSMYVFNVCVSVCVRIRIYVQACVCICTTVHACLRECVLVLVCRLHVCRYYWTSHVWGYVLVCGA